MPDLIPASPSRITWLPFAYSNGYMESTSSRTWLESRFFKKSLSMMAAFINCFDLKDIIYINLAQAVHCLSRCWDVCWFVILVPWKTKCKYELFMKVLIDDSNKQHWNARFSWYYSVVNCQKSIYICRLQNNITIMSSCLHTISRRTC